MLGGFWAGVGCFSTSPETFSPCVDGEKMALESADPVREPILDFGFGLVA